uniref:PA domain-containing protein n=1 Tax=Hanusia phi TaxID=3032 RepID=A0A7S0EEF0_9CRYP
MFAGFLLDGKKHGEGAICFPDGSHYTGMFLQDKMHGRGRFRLKDGSMYQGQFEADCPKGRGLLVDADGARFKVEYSGGKSFAEGCVPISSEEDPRESFIPSKTHCIGLCVYDPDLPEEGGPKRYPNAKDVKARVVYACPPNADVPLWNASEVRGKIVVIQRGPPRPAQLVTFSLKLFHAQQAGAVGVIFIDVESNVAFTTIPRVDEGDVVYPADLEGKYPPARLRAKIPCCIMLKRDSGIIQEGAVHVITFAPLGFAVDPRLKEFKIGFVVVPKQENKAGLSKSKATALMSEFFEARKKERLEEEKLLLDEKSDTKGDQLLQKEWGNSNFLDSLNPLKQVKATSRTDEAVAASIMQKLVSFAGEENVKKMKEYANTYLPSNLQAGANNEDTKIEMQWEVNEFVRAQRQDGNWQTASVVKVDGSTMEIQWCDGYNKEKMHKVENVRYSIAMPNSRTCSRGCGYAITWHATHCCESCRDGHAENVHGPKCDRLQNFPTGTVVQMRTEKDWKTCIIIRHQMTGSMFQGYMVRPVEQPDLVVFKSPHHVRIPIAAKGATPCAGQCGYAVTWHNEYCCFVCKASAGQGNHGLRCDKMRILGTCVKDLKSNENSSSLQPLEQNETNGFHSFELDDCVYTGTWRNALPDSSSGDSIGLKCSLRWPDGSQYHGQFKQGTLTGIGLYVFPDGSEFYGQFRDGRPGSGHLTDKDGTRYKVSYDFQGFLWEPLEPLKMEEEPLESFRWSKADSAALPVVTFVPDPNNGDKPKANFDYSHIRKISARLVWARPQHAEMPLWNAAEARGKIVAVMRGPRANAPPCNFSLKLFYCQQAGAVAVVFVECDPFARFRIIPRLNEGPIFPSSPSPSLQVRIPCCLIMNKEAAVLQEGAIHTMDFFPSGIPNIPPGWVVGVVVCIKQESKVGLSKNKAKELMSEFFEARKKERSQEGKLLKEKREKGEEVAIDKEFLDGSVLDSLNPLVQDERAAPPRSSSQAIAQAMLCKITSKQRASELAAKADEAASIFESIVHGALASLGPTWATRGNEPESPSTGVETQMINDLHPEAGEDEGDGQPKTRDVGIQCEPEQRRTFGFSLLPSFT